MIGPHPSAQHVGRELAGDDRDRHAVSTIVAQHLFVARDTNGLGAPPWERLAATAGSVDLRQSLSGLILATKQVTTTGTDEQLVRADAILTDARKRLYQLLAE